jgi:hypothetical protein
MDFACQEAFPSINIIQLKMPTEVSATGRYATSIMSYIVQCLRRIDTQPAE